MLKKIMFGGVGLILLTTPLLASAQSVDEQIASLLALIKSFQAQIIALQAQSGGQSFCHNFNNDLTVGSNGDEVSALNQALYSSGINTTGNTSSFDENTAGDAVSFQAKYGIRQTGYVGPLTRGKLNALYGCRNGQQPTQTTSQTAIPATVQAVTSSVQPAISTISPSQGSANTTITIYGTNLSGASSVEFYNSAGQMVASISAPSITSVTSTNVMFTIGGTFAANVSPGAYQVGVVTNACAGGCNSNRLGFTLVAPASNSPSISTISPSQGSANTSVTIYGTNLSGATSVEFYNSAGQFVAALSSPAVSSVTSTSIVFNLGGPFTYNVSPGTYQVGVVTNACAGGCNSNRLGFTLNAPSVAAPSISSITPSQGFANTSVTIYGTNLSGASSVEFYNSAGQMIASISAPSITSVTPNNVVFTIGGIFAANVSPGTYQVGVVTNACSGGCNSNRIGFTLSQE